MTKFLVYKNRFNEVKSYEIEIIEINNSYTLVKELPSGLFKTFKNDNIITETHDKVVSEEAANAAQKEYQIISRKLSGRNYINYDNDLEVCFTGFKAKDKKELISIAEKAGFFVRKSVTTALDVLVCGPNAGPTKMKMAHSQNVAIVIGVDGFTEFIQTGEISL